MKILMTHITTIVLTVFLGVSSPTYASSLTTLFNTGVDSGGNVLTNNTIGDPHYSLIAVPSGSTNTRIITSAGGFPIGPYLGDNTLSRWIGPNNDADLNGPVGNFTYRTTFDLTGFNPSTALISGKWSSDNNGLSILLNGVNIGTPAIPFTAFTNWFPFSISSGFVGGINTLDFLVYNGGGPTALRVEMAGTASAVPIPAALWLIGSALIGLVSFGRRKESIVA